MGKVQTQKAVQWPTRVRSKFLDVVHNRLMEKADGLGIKGLESEVAIQTMLALRDAGACISFPGIK